MARRKQSILKRDQQGNLVYDSKGRPVVERIVKTSGAKFRHGKTAGSGVVFTRTMTDEERERYGQPSPRLGYEERKLIGQAAILHAASERRFHSR